MLVGTVTAVFSIVWNMMFGGLTALLSNASAEEFAISTGMYMLLLLFSPVLSMIGLFVSTILYHVALLILGGGGRGFSVTFRAIAYGSTPNLLCVLPICGGFIGGIWAMVLAILAARQGHGTDWWRAILAYFLPLIACCCLGLWLAMTLGLLGAVFD